MKIITIRAYGAVGVGKGTILKILEDVLKGTNFVPLSRITEEFDEHTGERWYSLIVENKG